MSVPYALFITIISIFSLILLAGDALFITDPDIVSVIQRIDVVICFIFFIDFLYTFYKSPNRTKYFITWGWIDLLSSVPMVDQFRTGRLIRMYRLIRIMRGIKATKVIVQLLIHHRTQNTFLAVTLFFILVITISSISILVFENVPDANIKNAEDALWWSYVTITTVGYGDRYPITTEGRILGAIMMTIGVGLFGIFSGFVASWFLRPTEDKQSIELDDVHYEIKQLQNMIHKLNVELTSRTKYNNLNS